jgi:hypothetical protein
VWPPTIRREHLLDQESDTMRRVKKFAVPLVGVGVLALAAWPVYAHCGKCAGDCKEVLKQMEAGKLTAASMIATAEAHAKGKAVGLMIDLEKDKMDADVFVLVGDKVQAVAIGADGKAGKMDEVKSMTGMAAVIQAMDAAKVTMGAVIAAAEEKSKGKALAVTASATGGKASFEVYCLAGDKIQKVTVDNAGKAKDMSDTEATALPAAANEEKPKPKPGG